MVSGTTNSFAAPVAYYNFSNDVATDNFTGERGGSGNTAEEGMVFEVTTTAENETVIIPTGAISIGTSKYGVPYDWNMDWGDGVAERKTGASESSVDVMPTYEYATCNSWSAL
jgi:hypothetical protein